MDDREGERVGVAGWVMTDRELMRQALDALEKHVLEYETAEALRARLAQLEACIVKGCSNHRGEGLFVGALCSPCHTFITTGEGKYSQAYRNSQREWQGLTMEEIDALVEEHSGWPVEMVGHVLICAAEDKLKEKNT